MVILKVSLSGWFFNPSSSFGLGPSNWDLICDQFTSVIVEVHLIFVHS
jgi:hypothetical protein